MILIDNQKEDQTAGYIKGLFESDFLLFKKQPFDSPTQMFMAREGV